MKPSESPLPPMRDGFVDFRELVGCNIEIIGRRVQTRQDGGTFDVWLVEYNREMLETIPRGNALPVRYMKWSMVNPGQTLSCKVIAHEMVRDGRKIVTYDLVDQEEDDVQGTSYTETDNIPF